MLHATRPPPYSWPVMSHSGHDLLIQQPHLGGGPHQSRNVVAHHPGMGHEGGLAGGAHHVANNMGGGHHVGPNGAIGGGASAATNFNTGNINSSSGSSFYNPHHSGFIFPHHTSYTVHHPASRPSSREHLGDETSSLRHPSGGSVGSGTPPSPADDSRLAVNSYKHGVIRTSLEQRGHQQQANSCGSPRALGNGTPYRMQPPSPLPQKSPFDMTTMGMSKQPKPADYSHTSQNSVAANNTRPGTVISSGRVINASPYQSSSVNIKQEPGSPAQYGPASLVNRAVKQEPTQPNSPRNRNATPPPPPSSVPPPSHSSSSNSSSSSSPVTTISTPPSNLLTNSMERKQRQLQQRISQGAVGGQAADFNFPSPQPHVSTPISPEDPRPANKFRYPSGPQAVQNLSPGGESTSTSAMSSREGTPGPQGCGPRHSWSADDSSGPAPNIDISHVQVKEEFGGMRYLSATHDDYSRRPVVNLSYPAASTHMEMYSGYGSYNPSAMTQQVAVPPRSLHGMRPGGSLHHGFSGASGRPLSLPSNSESSSHSNVKIGRRPAHLPKVLKFSDNTLPHGWIRKLKQRKHGKQAGRWDVYIYSPCGVKFASRKKLRNFFEKNNLQYDPEDFDFTPYGRHIEQSAAHARHHSSSDGGSGGRHTGSSCSPSSEPSPSSSSFASHQQQHHTASSSEYKPAEVAFTSQQVPQPAHRQAYPAFPHPHQSMFSDYNPMMESPPNANALEVPQHQILNLSQTQRTTTAQPVHHPIPVSNFPPDIATILNEPSDSTQQSLREYQSDLTRPAATDTAEESTKEKEGEDSRFMARTYNLLTASQDDLGEMMDEYSIYQE